MTALSDVLYEILPEERLQRFKDRSVHVPEVFARLQGDVRNDPTKHHHARLPTLSMKSVQEMVEKLVQARGLPAIQSSSWRVV